MINVQQSALWQVSDTESHHWQPLPLSGCVLRETFLATLPGRSEKLFGIWYALP
jgi:hypothetical protein